MLVFFLIIYIYIYIIYFNYIYNDNFELNQLKVICILTYQKYVFVLYFVKKKNI